jgi:hypothetical protein
MFYLTEPTNFTEAPQSATLLQATTPTLLSTTAPRHLNKSTLF